MNEQWILTLRCVDKPGIVHAISGAIVDAGGNIEESQQFASADTGKFFMRLQISAGAAARSAFETRLRATLEEPAQRYEMDWSLAVNTHKCRTLLLASKATHCVNDLLFRTRSGQLPIEIPLILANHRENADLAAFYNVPFEHLPIAPAGTPEHARDKERFEKRMLEVIAAHNIELVVLARYMQILSPEMCEHLRGRAINIHHSFLPGFKGANPYRQAHRRGVKLIGATAHFVTQDLDEGPIIEQDVTRVDHSYSPEQLQQLGQDEEAHTLRRAVGWFAEKRILLDNNRTVIFR